LTRPRGGSIPARDDRARHPRPPRSDDRRAPRRFLLGRQAVAPVIVLDSAMLQRLAQDQRA
jgi:hypothetical protein